MMWNPVMADEMLDADCGWPHEPFLVDLEGGADDPGLTAAFEAVRYADLWTVISESGLGVCSVSTELEGSPDEVGRAYGFRYLVAPPGCPQGEHTGALRVSEYGTEAQRDAAGVLAAAGSEAALVLGRVVIQLDGDAVELAPALETLGAQVVP